MPKPDCPICAKAAALDKLAPDELIGTFPNSVALLGPWQFYHGYCILISRRHATELSQLGSKERRSYLDEMCLVARAIEECFHPHKLNYELLGNQVPHLHWHILPRYQHDAEGLRPVWLALERAEHDENERRRLQTGPMPRTATADLLRQKLKALIPSS